MRTAAQNASGAAAAGIRTAIGEVASELRCETLADQSAAAVEGTTGRRFSEPQGKRPGIRQTGIGEEPSFDGAGAGVDRGAGAPDALHQMLAADAGSVSGQA